MTTLTLPHLPLAPNPVWRSYRGGSELRSFRGTAGTPDDHFPEDWLASTVRARNGSHSQGPDEGLSAVSWEGTKRHLADLRGNTPEYFNGREDFGVLLKLLDAAERLHIQAHPDDAFVQKRLGGRFGKTECWYVISTRKEDASVLLGCQHAPTNEEWERLVLTQNITGLLGCFEKIPVKAGDCFMVPAGVPHAIGAGVFLLELQQPSDWVVRCEFTVGDHTLPPEARFMGMEFSECREIFDLEAYSADAWRQKPRVIRESAGHIEEEIVERPHQKFFQLRRLRGTGSASFPLPHSAVLVMVEGTGQIDYAGTQSCLRKGETVLLPASDQEAHWNPSANQWEMLLAHPPTL